MVQPRRLLQRRQALIEASFRFSKMATRSLIDKKGQLLPAFSAYRSKIVLDRKNSVAKILGNHLVDLKRSGLHDETIRKSGIRSASCEEISKIIDVDSKWLNSDGFLIPYFSSDGKIIQERPRLDKPPFGKDGRPCKYLSAKGSENRIYFPPNLKREVFEDASHALIITEGEKKALKACQEGLNCIALPGVWCFLGKNADNKSRPIPDLDLIVWKGRNVFIVFDSDILEKEGVRMAQEALVQELSRRGAVVESITLPSKPNGEKQGLDDFLVENSVDDFLKLIHERIEITDEFFEELGSEKLAEILGLTIKKDDQNKIITFLCQLSAYTENSQFNVLFQAPSSSGKSYLPTEVAKLFPKEDVIELGYCSPTAFFHSAGTFDEKKKAVIIDLERKIIIFLDQPHTQLLQNLRPLLSHDKKELNLKITDRNMKKELRAKNIIIRGFPSVLFCTANHRLDEQEGTRFVLLSPELDQEKILAGIKEKIFFESDRERYEKWLNENPDRMLLMRRIAAIKKAKIKDIKIGSPEKIEKYFLDQNKFLKPRHQRDVGRILCFTKNFALLNFWHRNLSEQTITSNEADIKEAIKVWSQIKEAQDHNLSPYVFNIFKEVILPLWNEKNEENKIGTIGLRRTDILGQFHKIHGRNLSDFELRKQIIPTLEAAGLIYQERDPEDKRHFLVHLHPLTYISQPDLSSNKEQSMKNNIGEGMGNTYFDEEAAIRDLERVKLSEDDFEKEERLAIQEENRLINAIEEGKVTFRKVKDDDGNDILIREPTNDEDSDEVPF